MELAEARKEMATEKLDALYEKRYRGNWTLLRQVEQKVKVAVVSSNKSNYIEYKENYLNNKSS